MAKMSSAMLQKMKSVMTKHKLLNGALNALQSKNLRRGLGRRRRVHHRRRMGCARMKKHSVRRRRRMGGASPSQFLQKAKTFLKKHQVLSRVGEFAIPFVPGPYVPLAQTAVGAIKRAGYGRKRHMRGGMHMMGMGRKRHSGMGVLPPAVFNTSTSNVGIPKF